MNPSARNIPSRLNRPDPTFRQLTSFLRVWYRNTVSPCRRRAKVPFARRLGLFAVFQLLLVSPRLTLADTWGGPQTQNTGAHPDGEFHSYC